MKNLFNSIVLIVSISIFTSCVKEDYGVQIASNCVSPNLSKTKDVSDIYAVAINSVATFPAVIPNTPVYSDDDVIEAYAISSDEGGNFYQSMYFQPTNGTKGFNLSADVTNIYNKIEPGRKVFIKLKGLGFANTTGSFAAGLILGEKPTDKYTVDRIADYNFKKYIYPSCDFISEDLIVNKVASITLLKNDTYLNTLVELDNVQFSTVFANGTYDEDRTDDFDSSIDVVDGLTTPSIAVRTSKYSNFAGNKTPIGSGKIRGVLTKYNNGYQIILRTERDVKFTNPRIIAPSTPLGGTNIVFNPSMNEDFSSYAVDANSFPKYINDKTINTKIWKVGQYPSVTGNKYLTMSNFAGAGSAPSRAYFLVPVDFTAASYFKFKKQVRYNAGSALKIYYVKSENYNSAALNVFNFTDITSKFNISYPNIGESESGFNTAGVYQIPENLSGNGYFVFEYTGTSRITSTINLDDIVIQ